MIESLRNSKNETTSDVLSSIAVVADLEPLAESTRLLGGLNTDSPRDPTKNTEANKKKKSRPNVDTEKKTSEEAGRKTTENVELIEEEKKIQQSGRKTAKNTEFLGERNGNQLQKSDNVSVEQKSAKEQENHEELLRLKKKEEEAWEEKLRKREEERRRRDEELRREEERKLREMEEEERKEAERKAREEKEAKQNRNGNEGGPAIDPVMQQYMMMVLEQRKQEAQGKRKGPSPRREGPREDQEVVDPVVESATLSPPAQDDDFW